MIITSSPGRKIDFWLTDSVEGAEHLIGRVLDHAQLLEVDVQRNALKSITYMSVHLFTAS
jgi:hypothetical protein